jgi:hypothetical protein
MSFTHGFSPLLFSLSIFTADFRSSHQKSEGVLKNCFEPFEKGRPMQEMSQEEATTQPPLEERAQPGTHERTTGPLHGVWETVTDLFKGFGPRDKKPQQASQGPQREQSAIEKMRDKLADFDEDYKDIGERLLGAFVQMVGYPGPFLLVLWIGSDLGKYYTPVMDATPAYGLAYTIEGIIAAASVAMGRSFAEVASGKPNYGKTALVVLIWAILNASSAFGLYLVITHNGNVTGIEQTSMIIRVCHCFG